MKFILVISLLLSASLLFCELIEIEENSGKELFSIETNRSDQMIMNFSLDHYEIETVNKADQTIKFDAHISQIGNPYILDAFW